MNGIQRIKVGKRMSQAVVFGDLVWLCGQCGTAHESTAVQTQQALDKVEALLLEAGSDKSRLLSVTIWLADIDDYDELNAVWDAWIPDGCSPARACGETQIAGAGYNLEIICVAALNGASGQ
jgi:enamine deaminase RidA (YjgF/YER057c/UK114 family)